MPQGPLGFPRLTSIGPLVTDGGSESNREPEIGVAVMWTDDTHDELKYGDVVIPSNIKEDSVTIRREAEAGRYTMTEQEFIDKTMEV